MEKKIVKISVRNLVEFILRNGDIDNRIAGADKEAMQLGAKIHRKIQRQMGSDYRAEVSLKYTRDCENFTISVEGRADGIIENAEQTAIDEIKGVFKEMRLLEKPDEIHLAQAKCYAYMYAEKNDIPNINVQVTYCNMETEEIKRFYMAYTLKELENWFFDLIVQYEKWARFQFEWRTVRNASIKEAEFPFDYRDGQKHLVTSVYKTILRKKRLFIQAPTGVGKTIATVFPAVKAVGEGLGEKVFYLTARTITRTVAQQAFESLKESGLQYKVITLTAKEKICFCDKADCHPGVCSYAKGHYDRINDAVYDLITTQEHISREVIEGQAEKWNVCPFELGLDISIWMDAIICDYNYVFDPNAHLKRFFGDGVRGEYIFLIDEAHNLVERGRDMYSASLYKEELLKVRRLVKEKDGKLAGRLEECNKLLLLMKRECDGYQVLTSAANVYLKLLSVMSEMERFLEEHKEDSAREEVLTLYFDIRMFLNIYERLDEHYLIYSEIDDENRFRICLFCVNPAMNLKEYLDKGNSTVFFSATLLPIQYYKRLLSTQTDDYAVYAQSSFEESKRLLMMGTDVSSKYTLRSEQMYEKYAQYLMKTAMAKKGNYIAFFPSYKFMEQVYDMFYSMTLEEENIECLMQSPYMSEESREIFLESFEEERHVSLMAFCVMGGIFSEGIDLVEDKLIGAVIVGTGLPQVCRERELLKQYFEEKGMDGFEYAYVYPGMNKVLQSAGRVIRTDDDRGVILLLDERFLNTRYRNTFPREWEKFKVCSLDNVSDKMQSFWESPN